MISVDLIKMRAACKAAAQTLQFIGTCIRPGITTADLDQWAYADTVARGGRPAPLNYRGFPRSVCTSVNDVVCHGIPGPYVLRDGDVVNVDVTTILEGHFGDTNATFCVGTVDPKVQHLVGITKRATWAGIELVRPGIPLGHVGTMIEATVSHHGYSVVREFGGHGIGRRFHDVPHVNHFANRDGPVLEEGMLFTIEPMINLGAAGIHIEPDGWTVRTQDGSVSAQFEHTVLVTATGFEVLTLP